jgi:hypothetical protein
MARRSKSKIEERNLLEMVPIRDREWSIDEVTKLVKITCPKFKGRAGKKLGSFFRIGEDFTVELDRYGSAVWELCDGKTVKAIGEALQEKFGDEVEPLYPRLSQFLAALERGKLIRFEE